MNSLNIFFFTVISLTLFFKPDVLLAKENNQPNLPPVPFLAKYDLYRGGIKMGESVYSLKRLGDNNYLLEGSAEPAGLLAFFPGTTAIEKSIWKFIKGSIQPVQYQYTFEAVTVKKKMISDFDWSSLVATVTHNKVTRRVPIKAGDLDHLLVPLAVMLDLKNGKLKSVYRYVDRRRIKQYEFKVIRNEWTQTSLGLFKTTLVETAQRSKKRNKIKRRTLFWGAPSLDYLPVRISHQSGDNAEIVMTLTKLRGELGYRLKSK